MKIKNEEFYVQIINDLKKSIIYEEDVAFIIDKNEGKYIGDHYAQSHLSVSLLIYGIMKSDETFIDLSKRLIKGYLIRYSIDSKSAGFHHDFNNFAISLYYLFYRNKSPQDDQFLSKLKKNILKSSDSKHFTTNWLPMRIFNLLTRQLINPTLVSNKIKIKTLSKMINSSTYTDFILDDRIPRGKSFNLQYNISTIASLKLISEFFEVDLDITAFSTRLIDFIDPEGDVNYMGRGANQIFAWGPWMYLISKSPQLTSNENCLKSEKYFISKYEPLISKGNIIINDYDVNVKDFWWDYHYSSVYVSHLLMWGLLSNISSDEYKSKVSINSIEIKTPKNKISGIDTYKSQKYFCMVFNGRSEYYAESGPSINNLWIEKYGYVFKGGYGPLPNEFGDNNYGLINNIFNFMGPITVEHNKGLIKLVPIVEKINIEVSKNELTINFIVNSNKKALFNIPIFQHSSLNKSDWNLYCDGHEVNGFHSTMLKNQYEYINVYQTSNIIGNNWSLVFKI